MKNKIILLFSLIMFLISPAAYAGIKEDYEQAYELYVAAGACMATYGDRYGNLVNRYLEQNGWKIDHYTQSDGNANARFLLAKKQLSSEKQMYVLAIVGTENLEDVHVNLKVDKVYFAGSNLEEFEINAAKIDVPTTEPKVHRGFHEFVQAGLKAKTLDNNGESKYLTDILLAHKDYKIYIVGHSLGGAAATLTGARLISMGVRPEQIEIITFGAPAVGNAAFAAKFGPLLNLTRVVISGDPVTGVLQTLVGGYKQFGQKIEWDMPAKTDQPHRITEYADLVLKNYYDKRQQALQAGLLSPINSKDGAGAGIYVAPLKNNLPESLATEYRYMQQALINEYQQMLPGCQLFDAHATGNLRESALSAGCKWLVIPEVSGYRLKQERNVYYISLTQTVYDVSSGAMINMTNYSTGTYNVTPLEAVIHDFRNISPNDCEWLHK